MNEVYITYLEPPGPESACIGLSGLLILAGNEMLINIEAATCIA